MSRRTSLPGAAELFRSTGNGSPEQSSPAPTLTAAPDPAPEGTVGSAAADRDDDFATETPRRRRPRAVSDRRPTGRERHDEKITVYVSADELLDLEHARLSLRGDHGLPVDRGRVVREALAIVLADFDAKGEASILVRRLRGR